jgi:hypothetical protein
MLIVSACQIRSLLRTGASVTCAPVRKASDGMLLSGVPMPGCRSPLPLGPNFAFQIGLGLANRRRREGPGHWQPTSVTALGGILVGDGRVAAGVSELGPAMSDGESGFPANYSRPGPTIIRDYSRRPRCDPGWHSAYPSQYPPRSVTRSTQEELIITTIHPENPLFFKKKEKG